MAKPKRPTDFNQRANLIARIATGEIIDKNPNEGKNIHAVELGRLGGLAGGKARSKSLSSKRRKQIALKAINTRWAKK